MVMDGESTNADDEPARLLGGAQVGWRTLEEEARRSTR